MNPYDNNPFQTDDNRINSEADANRALAEAARKNSGVEDWELFDPHCEWKNWTLED